MIGPRFWNTDFALSKTFPLHEATKVEFRSEFFNLFNHPNFDKPVSDVSDPTFGTIINVVSPPTSILGSFAGADASGRIIQLKAQLVF